MFKKLDQAIATFSITVMTIGMSVATIVAFINVILRYIFGASLSWAGALTSYLFIWSALFGAAYGFRIGMHIGVTFLVESLPPKIGKWLLSLSLLLIFIFLVSFTKWGIDFIKFSINLKQIDIDLRIPFWIIYLCVPVSLTLASYQVLYKLVVTLKTPGDEFDYNKIMKTE